MEKLSELIDLIQLKRDSECCFIGQNYKAPWKRVFGGQVLGQALHAAYQTVPKDRLAHSMHGYFILAGDIDIPIRYEVDTIRDGGSFTTRRVVAFQKDKAIFNMAASFQKRQDGYDHQVNVPNVLPPNVLLPDDKQIDHLKKQNPEKYKKIPVISPRPIEFRPVENIYTFQNDKTQPYRHVWMRSKQKMEMDLPLQHQLLAYASDYNLLTTALLPHRKESINNIMFLASLDHAIWFHRDFDISDWLLYALDSPSASNSRGFCRGSIYNEHGVLVASVAQEGLMRMKRKG